MEERNQREEEEGRTLRRGYKEITTGAKKRRIKTWSQRNKG